MPFFLKHGIESSVYSLKFPGLVAMRYIEKAQIYLMLKKGEQVAASLLSNQKYIVTTGKTLIK